MPEIEPVLLISVEQLLQHARDRSSEELLTLSSVLDQALPEIRERAGLEEYGSSQAAAFQCRRAAREVVHELQRRSYDAVRLAGYVEQGNKDWLEHEVALVRLEEHWLTIDLTAAQLSWFQGKPTVIILCEPGWTSLEAALRDSYSWWIPNQ
jgi:hypothetical protein